MSAPTSRVQARRIECQSSFNDLPERIAKVNEAANVFEAKLSTPGRGDQSPTYSHVMIERDNERRGMAQRGPRLAAENEKQRQELARLEFEAAVKYHELNADNVRLQMKITELEFQAADQQRKLKAEHSCIRTKLQSARRQHDHFRGSMNESMVDLCKECRERVGCCELMKIVCTDFEPVALIGGPNSPDWKLPRLIETNVYRHSMLGTTYKIYETNISHT